MARTKKGNNCFYNSRGVLVNVSARAMQRHRQKQKLQKKVLNNPKKAKGGGRSRAKAPAAAPSPPSDQAAAPNKDSAKKRVKFADSPGRMRVTLKPEKSDTLMVTVAGDVDVDDAVSQIRTLAAKAIAEMKAAAPEGSWKEPPSGRMRASLFVLGGDKIVVELSKGGDLDDAIARLRIMMGIAISGRKADKAREGSGRKAGKARKDIAAVLDHLKRDARERKRAEDSAREDAQRRSRARKWLTRTEHGEDNDASTGAQQGNRVLYTGDDEAHAKGAEDDEASTDAQQRGHAQCADDDEARTKDDEAHTKDDEAHTKDDEAHTKDDEARTKDDEAHTKDDEDDDASTDAQLRERIKRAEDAARALARTDEEARDRATRRDRLSRWLARTKREHSMIAGCGIGAVKKAVDLTGLAMSIRCGDRAACDHGDSFCLHGHCMFERIQWVAKADGFVRTPVGQNGGYRIVHNHMTDGAFLYEPARVTKVADEPWTIFKYIHARCTSGDDESKAAYMFLCYLAHCPKTSWQPDIHAARYPTVVKRNGPRDGLLLVKTLADEATAQSIGYTRHDKELTIHPLIPPAEAVYIECGSHVLSYAILAGYNVLSDDALVWRLMKLALSESSKSDAEESHDYLAEALFEHKDGANNDKRTRRAFWYARGFAGCDESTYDGDMLNRCFAEAAKYVCGLARNSAPSRAIMERYGFDGSLDWEARLPARPRVEMLCYVELIDELAARERYTSARRVFAFMCDATPFEEAAAGPDDGHRLTKRVDYTPDLFLAVRAIRKRYMDALAAIDGNARWPVSFNKQRSLAVLARYCELKYRSELAKTAKMLDDAFMCVSSDPPTGPDGIPALPGDNSDNSSSD